MRPHTTKNVVDYVLSQLKQIQRRPLIVGLSGPQGSGKSSVVKAVAEDLRHGWALNVVEFSLDDIYLTHQQQQQLAQNGNMLLQHRGLPGTHDIGLCLDTLASLSAQKPAFIPQYDKSAFNGEGDRSAETVPVTPEYDVVLVEGWCVGFESLPEQQLETKWKNSKGPLSRHSLDNVKHVNKLLEQYRQVWDKFDALVHLDAETLQYVYEWRLQQEHDMIKVRGTGMNDDQVRAFVDGYMPAYELYNDRFREYKGKNKLRLVIDKQRRPVNQQKL